MARKPRLHYPGALYHVMLRGNDKQKIFFSNSDRKYFYYLLNEGVVKYSYRVHAFCLMGNHVHFAIQVGDTPLAKIIHNLAFRYTQFINARKNRVGHLFQGRYKAILVDSESYFKELIRYIHLNPIRAKLVSNLNSYVWSSHHDYLGRKTNPWVSVETLLGSFSSDKTVAIHMYREYMEANDIEVEHKLFTLGNRNGYSILCEDDFMSKLSQDVVVPQSNLSIDDIALFVAKHHGVTIDTVKGPSKKQLYSTVRMITGLLVEKLKVATLTDVARYYNRDLSSLIHLIKRKCDQREINNKVDWLENHLKMPRCQA